MQVLPYLFTVLSFFGGWYMSYLSYSYKVDSLAVQINGLTNAITNMTTKQDNATVLYNALEKRVSILEIRQEPKPIENRLTKN